MLPDDYENLSETVIASNFFGNNVLSAITTKDYWAVANEYKPLMHTWYVGVLMQFYIIYPLFFFIARRYKTPRKAIINIISILGIISLLIYFGTIDAAQRFYYLPSRFYEFAVGGIVALIWKPTEDQHPFHKWFVLASYIILLALLMINIVIITANLKLVAVVALTAVLIMSGETLENKITGNTLIAKVGAASYSIFIWHQLILAFYRYAYSTHFTFWTATLMIIALIVVSFMTYHFVEQKTQDWLNGRRSKYIFYVIMVFVFVTLTALAGYIYKSAGVVRDIPELGISKTNIHRGMHAEYCDRGYHYDKPFETEKPHWLVVGDSFGRDFVNIIAESSVSDSVEVSYIYATAYRDKNKEERFGMTQKVFISTIDLKEELVTDIEALCHKYHISIDDVYVVGEKNFGESNGQIYSKRRQPNYFAATTQMESGYIEKNYERKILYGDRYIDMLEPVLTTDNQVKVFTPDNHFISADCRHLTQFGAQYYCKKIDWNKFFRR